MLCACVFYSLVKKQWLTNTILEVGRLVVLSATSRILVSLYHSFYICQLVSDSVKMKQTHSSLLSEKQTISKQLQQVNSSLEFLKTKVTNGEEQVPFLIHWFFSFMAPCMAIFTICTISLFTGWIEQMKAHVTQAVKASTESRHININMEKNKLELIDAEKELKWLRTTVSSVEKEYERNQKKITDLRIELEKERCCFPLVNWCR